MTMRTFKTLSLTLGLAFTGFVWADVTKAKATELGVHRTERLVTLGRIDPSFLTHIYSMSIENALDVADGAKFVVKNRQYQAPATNQNILTMRQDLNGRTLSHTVDLGDIDPTAPVWPDKDAATLVESALHYVIENGPTNAEVAPFDADLTSLTLIQSTGSDSQVRAVVDFHSSTTARVLRATLKADATIESTQLSKKLPFSDFSREP